MSNISKEILKNYVKEQNFKSPDDVLKAMKDMFKDVLQQALDAELDTQLGYDKYDYSDKQTKNSRNGSYKKTIKSLLGPVELDIPRDRYGEYEPQIVPKFHTNVNGIEEKVMSLYAAGMTTRDIAEQVKNLYDIEISADMVSNITNRILPIVTEWQNRPLEKIYPFVFLDAIVYKVREDNQIIKKAAYIALGVNMDGEKEVLGIWIGVNESSKFWLSILNDLKSRGIQDVLIFCVDGLNGFKDAIEATYPFAKIQRCIIHQLRSSMKYVLHKDRIQFVTDLKSIYNSTNKDIAYEYFLTLKEKWGKNYPTAIKGWQENWDNIITCFEFPKDIRKIMYTTNAIESLNSQFRKVTKTRLIFPNDESLVKMLYLAVEKISKKWNKIYTNWDLVVSQLYIQFDNILCKNV